MSTKYALPDSLADVICPPDYILRALDRLPGVLASFTSREISGLITREFAEVDREVITLTPLGLRVRELLKSGLEKSPTSYKVWISVEACDAQGDQIGDDIDLPFSSCAQFKHEGDAVDFATALNLVSKHPELLRLLSTLITTH